MSIMVVSRTYFSLQHIKSAALFSKLSAENQTLYDTSDFSEVQNKNDAYVTGCIFSSVAFLEGTINELFEDMARRNSESILQRGIGGPPAELMAGAWKQKKPQLRLSGTLSKYKTVLAKLELEPFNEDQNPYRDAFLLIKLRNALTHHVPISTMLVDNAGGNITVQELEELLIEKFEQNPQFKGKANSFFPHKCLGHGCAEWAVRSALNFADTFFTKIGEKPPYEFLRPSLQTE